MRSPSPCSKETYFRFYALVFSSAILTSCLIILIEYKEIWHLDDESSFHTPSRVLPFVVEQQILSKTSEDVSVQENVLPAIKDANVLENARINDNSVDPKVLDGKSVKHVVTNGTNVDHCVWYNFLTPSSVPSTEYEPITLALHSTINYVPYLAHQAETWDDVISYAIFLYPGDEVYLPVLKHIHTCNPLISAKTAIHLVWMQEIFQTRCFNEDVLEQMTRMAEFPVNCEGFDFNAATVQLKTTQKPFAMYPINVMRNEARRGAHTALHLVADVETHFSKNFTHLIRNLTEALLAGEFGKSVLVYRRFEMALSEIAPNDIFELYEMYTRRDAQQFHSYFYKQGHMIPRINEYFNYSMTSDVVIFEHFPYTRQEWEPQFIMTNKDPYHVEFAITRLNDQQTLCHILCRAEYNFLVMSHVFNIHPGIKRGYTIIEEALSKHGRSKRASFFRRYNTFLDKTYPRNPRTARCPTMSH